MHERLGSFEDKWSPERLLKGTPLEVLLGSESVLAVGEAEHGDSGDLSVRVKRTEAVKGGSSYDEVLCIAQGVSALVALRCKLHDILSQEGNTHWGDSNDVQALSQSLSIGVLMFCDGLQKHGQTCLYSLGLNPGDFAFWMSIWWQEPVHFRRAELCVVAGDDWRSF